MNIELAGTSIIGQTRGSITDDIFRAYDPSTGNEIEPRFHSATIGELEQAASLANAARIPFGNSAGRERAVFLRKIADNIEALGNTLIQRASLETAVPNERFVDERARKFLQAVDRAAGVA